MVFDSPYDAGWIRVFTTGECDSNSECAKRIILKFKAGRVSVIRVLFRGNFIYSLVEHSAILRSAHTVCVCVLYGSQNKQ